MIDPDNPEVTMKQEHIVYVVDVQEDVSKKYNEMFGSKIVTPSSKKLIM